MTGLNIFWVRQEEVGHRLQAIAAVQSARVATVLPDHLEVRIVERAPVAVWQSGEMSFLVDADGRVLRTHRSPVSPSDDPRCRDAAAPGSAATLIARALATMFKLQQLLPGVATLQPRGVRVQPRDWRDRALPTLGRTFGSVSTTISNGRWPRWSRSSRSGSRRSAAGADRLALQGSSVCSLSGGLYGSEHGSGRVDGARADRRRD